MKNSTPNGILQRAELEQQAYRDLVRYAKWLSSMNYVKDHWMLNFDDLMAEALLALARCIEKYLDDRDYNEFLMIARTSMFNAIKTAKYKALMTYRKMELHAPSLDDENYDVEGGVDPAVYYDSTERILQLMNQLSSGAYKVLNALLGGDPRVGMHIELQRMRRNNVFKDPTISLTVRVLSHALCMKEIEVKSAMQEIREGMLWT